MVSEESRFRYLRQRSFRGLKIMAKRYRGFNSEVHHTKMELIEFIMDKDFGKAWRKKSGGRLVKNE